ncbi:galactosylgalactosylxylosylprotein 3-beta-glucuronosyltransferase 3-like isoform X2 [Babylonia areolata]|uniref:galactosylgalactosylxylosylprotein 3-beta-glucuronosyltransferase 3-like isoform X2 n=1 Tax=Babylonia areolata TaxID=304850 RepID=UPI003FD2D2E6
MRSLIQPRRFVQLYLVLVTCAVILLLASYAAWCPDEEVQAERELLETYRERLQKADITINNLNAKLSARPSQISVHRHQNEHVPGLPTIYLITPTHTRTEQKAELVRLSHTLLHIYNIHWIVIEDSEMKTPLVTNFLSTCGLNYTHLSVLTPPEVKMKDTDPNWLKPRGVLQRNAGLSWLRETARTQNLEPAVVYFADDDNTYSLQLFEEMRSTKKVSVWPVGLVGGLRYESPIVTRGTVTGWYTYWKPQRPFAMDMAGFAVNLRLILQHPNAQFTNAVQRGYQESTLLTGLGIMLSDLEPKANGCTKVLVWHTRTEKTSLKNEDKMRKKLGKGSDPSMEV